MKKYIKPIALVFNVEPCELICESLAPSDKTTTGAGIPSMQSKVFDFDADCDDEDSEDLW